MRRCRLWQDSGSKRGEEQAEDEQVLPSSTHVGNKKRRIFVNTKKLNHDFLEVHPFGFYYRIDLCLVLGLAHVAYADLPSPSYSSS